MNRDITGCKDLNTFAVACQCYFLSQLPRHILLKNEWVESSCSEFSSVELKKLGSESESVAKSNYECVAGFLFGWYTNFLLRLANFLLFLFLYVLKIFIFCKFLRYIYILYFLAFCCCVLMLLMPFIVLMLCFLFRCAILYNLRVYHYILCHAMICLYPGCLVF